MPSQYVLEVQKTFSAYANQKNATPMKRYMQDKFDFLGIQAKQRQELQRAFMQKDILPDADEIGRVIRELWALPEREYQYFAMELLEKYLKRADDTIVSLFEYMIITKSWWDTVDKIASRLVCFYFKAHKELIEPYTEKWMYYGNMWLQRTALLFQLKYKKETDTDLLFGYIQALADSQEFFIQKAIGWILREYSKTNPRAVKQFVASTSLAPLSRREALKIINKK